MNDKNVNVKKSQEITLYLLTGTLTFTATMAVGCAEAGVTLGATCVIYPAEQKRKQFAVTNNDENSTYLTQSWVENADGVKDSRSIVTPPLFAMRRKKEGILRILDATSNRLPQDWESLFRMSVKAVPSMDKPKLTENAPQLAIISHIRLYYRPAKLALPSYQAAGKLRFRRSTNSLTLINPMPYYLTVIELSAGTRVLENTLVPPTGRSTVKLPSDTRSNITYRTINDYGALTPEVTGVIE